MRLQRKEGEERSEEETRERERELVTGARGVGSAGEMPKRRALSPASFARESRERDADPGIRRVITCE